MITPTEEKAVLIEHTMSFLGAVFTMYFNNNRNIQVIGFMDMLQHLIKVVRCIIYGFELKGSPPWFCYLHSFINCFSHNCVLILTCFVIFNLFTAIKYPITFSKYQKKIRPYVYSFTVIYIGALTLIAFYEPLFVHYTPEQIVGRTNCSCAYRYKFYQYLFVSPTFQLPLLIASIYCAIYIVYKIRITPRKTLVHDLTVRTRISFSRWIKILCICIAINLISFLNIYQEIDLGIRSEKEGYKENDDLNMTYYFTASSGIILFLLTNSFHQIKKKLGMKVTTNYGYGNSSFTSSNYRFTQNSNITGSKNVSMKKSTDLSSVSVHSYHLNSSLPLSNNNNIVINGTPVHNNVFQSFSTQINQTYNNSNSNNNSMNNSINSITPLHTAPLPPSHVNLLSSVHTNSSSSHNHNSNVYFNNILYESINNNNNNNNEVNQY